MTKKSIVTRLVDDGVGCEIEMREGTQILGKVAYDAETLSQFIQQLGEHRAAMRVGLSPKLRAGTKVSVTSQPEWNVPKDPTDKARVLVLRHAGFGWLGFHMTVERAREIAAKLGSVDV